VTIGRTIALQYGASLESSAAHWGLPDPAGVGGTDEEKRRAFRDAFLVLKHRIELLASRPLDKLSGLALRDQLRDIGKQ